MFGTDRTHGSQNSLPSSPRVLQRRQSGDPPRYILEPYRASRLTQQQFARPLQRANSYASQASSKDGDDTLPTLPEHMLRRKTPNGILAAAYDGTSVEHSEKPHAMKHILLPITTGSQASADHANFNHGLKQDLPTRASAVPLGDGNSLMQAPTATGKWTADMDFGAGSLNSNNWLREQYQLPQLDSIMHQAPLHHPQLPYQPNMYSFPGNVLPPFQTPLGPTASGEQGPYGPYWPNGTFIPYRPAELKDPRFGNQPGTVWPSLQTVKHPGQEAAEWRAFNTIPSFYQHESNPFFGPSPLPNTSVFNTHAQAFQQPQQPQQHQHPYLQLYQRNDPPTLLHPASHQFPQLNNRAQTYGNEPPLKTEPLVSYDSSGQTTPIADSTLISEFGPHSSNAELRENVFRWAHTVYIDLIAYIHQTKRNAQAGRHGGSHAQPSRPSIYPKPPRQPGSKFTTPPTSRRRSYNNTEELRSNGSGTDIKANLFDAATLRNHEAQPRPNGTWLSSGLAQPDHAQQQGPSLQQMQQQQIFNQSQNLGAMVPADKLRTLRRTSGNSVSISSMSSPSRLDASPSLKAASALEHLTKLCHGSEWKWIEGMLLGGCLAYALGDYLKALRWYSKIMSIDAKYVSPLDRLSSK